MKAHSGAVLPPPRMAASVAPVVVAVYWIDQVAAAAYGIAVCAEIALAHVSGVHHDAIGSGAAVASDTRATTTEVTAVPRAGHVVGWTEPGVRDA